MAAKSTRIPQLDVQFAPGSAYDPIKLQRMVQALQSVISTVTAQSSQIATIAAAETSGVAPHVLASESGLGPDHTVTGLVPGDVLMAVTQTTAKFGTLAFGQLADTDANTFEAPRQGYTIQYLNGYWSAAAPAPLGLSDPGQAALVGWNETAGAYDWTIPDTSLILAAGRLSVNAGVINHAQLQGLEFVTTGGVPSSTIANDHPQYALLAAANNWTQSQAFAAGLSTGSDIDLVGNLEQSGAEIEWRIQNTDDVTDEGTWRMHAEPGQLIFSSVSDDGSDGENWLSATRIGEIVDAVNFSANSLTFNGDAVLTSSTLAAGTNVYFTRDPTNTILLVNGAGVSSVAGGSSYVAVSGTSTVTVDLSSASKTNILAAGTALQPITGISGSYTNANLTLNANGQITAVANGTGGGSGTVTSVGLSDGSITPIYAIGSSPVTSSGTLAFTLNTQAVAAVFAGPGSGAAAQPTFRALLATDVPTLNQSTTGNAATASAAPYSGLTGTVPTWNQNTTGNAATATNVAYSGLTGTVPTWNQSTTGNAATASAAPYSGLTGTVPTWNQNTTGTAAGLSSALAITSGGTGQTTAAAAFNALSPLTTAGDILYGAAAGAGTRLGIGTTGYVLTVVSGLPAWAAAAAGGSTGANPTASVGLATVNGVATTFMRSDAAPALSQAIAPTWTGAHTWTQAATFNQSISAGGTGVAALHTLLSSIQTNPAAGAFTTDAYLNISGVGGNYLAFGQYATGAAQYGQWLQSGYSNATAPVYWSLTLNPLGGTIYLGANASVSAAGALSGSNFSGASSGTNTGDQTITLTSEVTGSGTGSFATTINKAISPTWTGNHTFTPAAGDAVVADGVSGGWAGSFYGANSSTGDGLRIVGNFTGSGPTGLLTIYDVNNTNGASIQMTGNGATAASKFLRVNNGIFQIINSAYSASLMNVGDDGTFSVLGSASVGQALQVTGTGTNGFTGAGAELYGNGSNGGVQAYNRSTAVYLPMDVVGTSIGLLINGTGTASFQLSTNATYATLTNNSSGFSAAFNGVSGLQINNASASMQSVLDFGKAGVISGRIRNDYVGNMYYVATGAGEHVFFCGGDSGSQVMNINSSGAITFSSVATTTVSPAAGGAGALPATPKGYFTLTIGSYTAKVPYY